MIGRCGAWTVGPYVATRGGGRSSAFLPGPMAAPFGRAGSTSEQLPESLLILFKHFESSQIAFSKTSGLESVSRISASADYILCYAKDSSKAKYRSVFGKKDDLKSGGYNFVELSDRTRSGVGHSHEINEGDRPYAISDLTKPGPGSKYDFEFHGVIYTSGSRWWGTTPEAMTRLDKSDRIQVSGKNPRFIRYLQDSPVKGINNYWADTGIAGFASNKVYVVQTNEKVIERCVLMTTDPGDLVLDPTCGSGTSAYVAEEWGRRWITIDTSRVALALARARVMGARYPYYLLADSPEGQRKEAEITRKAPSEAPTRGDVRQGFVFERVPHITLKSIANNAEIDVIWERWQETLEPLREDLNATLNCDWEEWQVPREASEDWSAEAAETHSRWWEARITRQKEIDASIAAKADYEYLYDKPYEDNRKVRVAGPFTVDSLSPHRVLAVDENDELVDRAAESSPDYGPQQDFAGMILEQLRTAGVQQAHKEDRITFAPSRRGRARTSARRDATSKAGEMSGPEKRAGIFIGPEFGTVSRPDLVAPRARRATPASTC